MAESGVNYRLDSGTLAAVKGAGVGGETQERLAKAAGAEALQDVVKGVEEQIVEKQEDTASREDAWDTGFDAMGDRGSWASGELYDQFQNAEETYKDEYLEAVRKGDTKKQKRLLKDQGARSSGLQEWKKTMETAKQIHDSPGGWADSLGADEKEILKALTKLDGKTAKVRFGEQGEMVFDITLPDGRTITKTRRQVDEMIAQGVYPAELELQMIKTNQEQVKNGLEGGLFDLEGTTGEIALSITDNQLPALMNQKWKFGGGGTFRDHIKSHPDFKATYVDGGYMSTVDITPEDGELTSADMAGFTPAEMDLIVDEMEKDPKTARGYVADWLARTRQQNHQKGVDEKAARDKAEYEKNKPAYKDSRTSYERILDRDEQDRLKKIEIRKKPLVIGGQPWGHVAVEQYFKDKATGEWVWNNNPGGSTPILVKVKDHVKKRGGDYNAIIAELERLQMKTSSKPSGTSGLLEGGSGTMKFD